MNGKAHSTLLALAGLYVLYQAYGILEDYLKGSAGMSDALAILSVTVLALGGLGVLYYAWVTYKRSKTADEEEDKGKEEQAIK